MQGWEIVSANGPGALALNEQPSPEPGPGQVRVDVVASCITYRDLATVENPEPRGIPSTWWLMGIQWLKRCVAA